MIRFGFLCLALMATAVAQADQGSALALSELQTCSSAPVKALRIFEVGEARLARPECDSAHSLLTPPLELTFAYQRAIPGQAMAKAALVMIERNLSDADFDALEARLIAFSDGYQDIDSGDAYHLRYASDGKLELWLNDELLRTEQGHDFAKAYLSIWFGDKPYSDDLKQRLLSNQLAAN